MERSSGNYPVASDNQPRTLILETSGRVGQVALAEGRNLLSLRRLDEARRHARDLVPAVAELLAEQNWKPEEVHAVIVSRGPGSYTGLRVGIMSAKTFAYATGSALIGVETFNAIALQTLDQAFRVEVIADAQKEKVYVQCFARTGSSEDWRPESALRIENVNDWLAALLPDVWVTGPGLHLYGKRLPASVHQVGPEQWEPRPESLLRLGLARFLSGARDNVWSVEPIYLRPSSAEEQRTSGAT